jgi:hypothetical protein
MVAMEVEDRHPLLANPLLTLAVVAEALGSDRNPRPVAEGRERRERSPHGVGLELGDEGDVLREAPVSVGDHRDSAHENEPDLADIEGAHDRFERG